MQDTIINQLTRVKRASTSLIHLTDDQISKVLCDLAELAVERQDELLRENMKDLDRMDSDDPKYDRLLLNEQRLKGIADDLRNVASLGSPLNKIIEQRTLANGLQLSKVSVPLGVIGIVYESRPNVTFDVFSLCLKSGNACVLKGSKDAKDSNQMIVSLIHETLQKHGIDTNIVYLAPSEREALQYVLTADSLIDIVIPRGSQALINHVREHAKVPVIETGAGICHLYFDETADLQKGKQIITNAKARRVSVCNALDCVLIHGSRLDDLPEILSDLDKQYHVEVYADKAAHDKLKGHYNAEKLQLANANDYGKEWLSYKISIKTVANLEEALTHIREHSSKHSEAIVAENEKTIEQYLKSVDAAVVYANASTAFTDGAEFGLGAEIGISTQKLHARGPMALNELTSYKWVVRGKGQIRQ